MAERNATNSPQFIPTTAFGSAPMSPNGSSPVFTPEETEALKWDRKRFLAFGHLTMGAPLEPTWRDQQSSLIPETAATSSSHTEASTGNGCNVDHGATHYVQTLNPDTGKEYTLEVKEDSGTPVNWISPRLVNECNFPMIDVPQATEYEDFSGMLYSPKKKVKIPWAGKRNKSTETEFFVAKDGSPFELLVGSVFMNEEGPAQELFPSKRERSTTLIMMQKRMTESERLSMRVTQAQADQRAAELDRKRREQRSRKTVKGLLAHKERITMAGGWNVETAEKMG